MPLRTPAAKLPLTARKDYKDKWEAEKPKYEAKIKEVLGETWTIDLNPNLVYVYASDDYNARIGTTITWYMDSFVSNLKDFGKKFKEDGINELNTLASKHVLYFGPQDGTDFPYGGLVIKDGTLQLVFNEDKYVSNVNEVSNVDKFTKAIKDAPPVAGGSMYNLNARNSVAKDFDAKIEKIRSSIAEMSGIKDVKLDGNWEENSAVLAQEGGPSDWDTRIGYIAFEYFRGLESVLKSNKFKEDDMLQEAFQEAVDKNIVRLRFLPEWEDGSGRYNRVKVDGGVLYLESTVKNWASNVTDAASKLMDIL